MDIKNHGNNVYTFGGGWGFNLAYWADEFSNFLAKNQNLEVVAMTGFVIDSALSGPQTCGCCVVFREKAVANPVL